MKTKSLILALAMAAGLGAAAQETLSALDATEDVVAADTAHLSLVDSLLLANPDLPEVVSMRPLPRQFFMPAVFVKYNFPEAETPQIFVPDYSGTESLRWIEGENALQRRVSAISQRMALSSPAAVRYNVNFLPEPPKQYTVVIDPQDHTVQINEVGAIPVEATVEATEQKRYDWINTFNGSLQFSQAYVSPNWYQGGNNNLNVLLNLLYNIKLNQAFHPNLLFETTVQYKLGLNSAPDDSIRSYNISEDLFQVNSTFGLKAAHRWYYTVNMQFKTQLLNSYKSNSHVLRSALLSPGELNVGVGMTYNVENKKKTVRFDASISPLSYNMMICTNSQMDETAYGIKPGMKTVSKIGSSMECKLMWKICDNITLNSRFFGFTDYDRAYCDLENTLVFEINKYFTTQVFAHLRYDTDTPVNDPDWHKLQLKEILSLGFAYKFTTH